MVSAIERYVCGSDEVPPVRSGIAGSGVEAILTAAYWKGLSQNAVHLAMNIHFAAAPFLPQTDVEKGAAFYFRGFQWRKSLTLEL